ncbi:MAG TPA: hypothetical protein PLR86_02755 [Planctomycetota bacterium]|nr:hypothetical protein [Planctomycetota bacterium]
MKNRFIYPSLQFLNINQIKGYIGITGTTNSEITTIASHNIRKLAQHQMPIVFHPNFPMQNHFIQTFQYSNTKVDLTLNIKMHKKITMAQTVIHKADITTVFLHPNKERVVCQYQLTHTQQPYFIFQLPKNANLWSITINEKGQKPIQYKSAISIPLPLQNTPVQIQIIYERTIPPLAICGQRRLESPLLSKKIPILSKNWTVYTPEQYSLDVETESLKEMFLEELSSIDFMYLFFGKYSMRAPTVVEKMVAEDIQDFSRIRPTRPTPPMPSPAPSRSRGRYPQKPMTQAKRQKDRFDQMMSQPKIEEYDDEDNSVDEMRDYEDDSVDEIEYESMPQEAEEMYEEEAKEMPKQKSIWERPKGLEQQLGYAKRSKSYSKKQEGVFTETGKMKKYPAPKKWKPQDTTVTSTVKAAGLLSLNISLSDKGTKKIYREIPPQRSTHTITYIHTTLHQVICAAILSLSTLLSLCVMCQKRFPRLPWILFFLSIAFLFPYNPQYIAYLNFWAYGIFLAIGFRFIFVVWKKLFTLKNNAVICLFLILFSSSAFAQERKMQTMSTVPTVPTTISTYVPYYPDSPEITDKTIYIPWEQFTKYNLTRTPIEESISFQTQYKVDITETQILCQSIFHIQTNKDNDSVFVGLQNSAIQSAYISTEKDKNPLSLQPRKDGYYALIPYKGNYTLDITYTPQGNLQPNQGNCQIHCCTPCLLTVSAPSYTQIHYDNLQDYYYFQTTNTQNTLICHPTQNIVEFYWRPKQHPQDVENNIQANTRHMLTLQDNTLTLQSNIQYNIASGSVSQLSLEIPKEYGIFELTGTYVEKWTQTPQKDNHQITVLLSNNLQKRIQIQLLAKKHIVNIPSVETFPNILLHNIQRENGQAILKTHNHYQILPKEYSNISKTNSNQEQEYFVETYNFYKKYDLPFQINYQQNNSISKSNLHLQIKEEKLYAIYNANIENKGAPLYSISYSLPAGYQVLNIQGNNIKTTQIQNNLLYITFHTPLQKNSKLNITLEMEQEWNKPIPFELPKIFSPDIQKQTGSILLTTTPQIQIIPQNIQNLISDDTLHYEIQHNLIHRYAYIFEDTNYQANIQIQQQQPILQATQNIHLLLETDWISKSYTIQYQILHAPTNKFQITMPSELNPQIQGHNIQRTTQQTENKKTTHTIYLHTPVQNSYTLTIYPSLQENKESLINIESLELHDTQTLGTTIQVQNQSDYELVVTKLKNLTNMNTNNANIILAYKTQDKDWQLQFSQNRQPTFHPIKATIPNIYIFTILDETNRTYTQITYHLQQTGLQFLELENVPENIWAMYVNFQTVTPIQKITLDNRKIHLIPLQNTSQQIIQVIYTEVHKTKIEPKIPTISNVQEINNLYWTISLPNTKKYTFQSNLNPISYATNFNPASYFASISSQNIEQLQIIPESQNIKNIENAILQQNRIQLQQSIPTHEPEQYGTRNYLDADKIKNTKLHTNILKESYSLETHQQFVQRQYQKQRTSPKPQPTTQTALLQLSAPSSNISYYFTKKQSTPQLTINIHDPNNWLIPVVQIIAFFLLLCISLWKYPKTWKKKFIHLIILGIILYIVVQYVPLIYYIL